VKVNKESVRQRKTLAKKETVFRGRDGGKWAANHGSGKPREKVKAQHKLQHELQFALMLFFCLCLCRHKTYAFLQCVS